jgi:hypothetical protein
MQHEYIPRALLDAVAALPATHNQTLLLRRTVCGKGGGDSGNDNDQVTQAAGKV